MSDDFDVTTKMFLFFSTDICTYCCIFLLLVPLESHGRTFNFCIWYVQLNGSNDSETVQPCMDWFNKVCTNLQLVVWEMNILDRMLVGTWKLCVVFIIVRIFIYMPVNICLFTINNSTYIYIQAQVYFKYNANK